MSPAPTRNRRRHTVRRAAAAVLLAAILLVATPRTVLAGLGVGRHVFDPGGRVRAVRTLDVDGDGRRDLVVLVENAEDGGQSLLVLRTPEKSAGRAYYPDAAVQRIPCDGPLAHAGAIAVGRFGKNGEPRIRFLGPAGITELRPNGQALPTSARLSTPTLFARSPGRSLFFWDGIADLDGDGRDEMWFPRAAGNGPIQVLAGAPAGDRVLTLMAKNRASTSSAHLLARTAHVPNLFPADLDGDGQRELVALRDGALLAWPIAGNAPAGGTPVQPTFRLPLPFLRKDVELGPEDVRTPRLQLADVDGDGITDLLVTLITGKRSRLDSVRTIFFHYPGPFTEEHRSRLVRPRVRIDTQSVVLHPTFIDLDGDGDLDYVSDSIRGTKLDMITRLAGVDPEITFVGFRFDQARKTYEAEPYFTIKRRYASREALSNRFGRSAWFGGDFDGDGHTDLLDLGNLSSVEIVRAVPRTRRRWGDPLSFERTLVGPLPVEGGLTADAIVADIDGDGRTDAVLWSEKSLFLIVSRTSR